MNYMVKVYSWNYLFILPGVILLFLFAYIPMFGVQIAFKDYKIYTGIWQSPWVGFKHFSFFSDSYFWFTVRNTIILTLYRTVINFPAPIILALMINEVRNEKFKRVIQSTTYLPHFISWVVVAYMFNSMLALDTGVVNNLRQLLGGQQVNFMGEVKYFRSIIVFSGLWKSVGWSTIIYLAALSAIDPQQHEAAIIDGANRLARIWYINIPGIMPTIAIILILSMPSILSAGYEQILPFVNPTNMEVSCVLDIYLIRLGLTQAQYSVASAIGLVTALLSLFLILGSNYAVKKMGQGGLW
ncbi:MAG: sugar ABC transporter permease [Clostridiaceae bacterium]|nr:sugar ABC transporter permease [Clostridiaceae bacterium]